MEKCTDTVVNWMIRCNAINEADKELYKYALYSFFLLVSPLILAGGVGFGLGSVKHGVALIFPFLHVTCFFCHSLFILTSSCICPKVSNSG